MRFFKNTDKKAMKETSKLLMTGKVTVMMMTTTHSTV